MPNPGHITPPGEPPASIVIPLPRGLPRTLVSEYIDACRKDLSALKAALVARDYERAQVIGHQMKATGRPYGFPDLTTLGSAIERAAASKNAAELDQLLQQLADYLGRVEIPGV
jgi:HPt (histidine-containing phosphotransfer) domain-containing protein